MQLVGAEVARSAHKYIWIKEIYDDIWLNIVLEDVGPSYMKRDIVVWFR